MPSATAAAVRTSSRAAAPSEKARAISSPGGSSARGRQSATQLTQGKRNDRVSFVAVGQRKKRELSKLGGEEDWEGGGMDDSSRTGPPSLGKCCPSSLLVDGEIFCVGMVSINLHMPFYAGEIQNSNWKARIVF